jgi:hypothetical protein
MKKRIILTESEKERILNLHVTAKNRLSEQQDAQQPAAQQPAAQQPVAQQTPQGGTTSERWKTATCAGLGANKKPACKDKVLQVQIKINDKCPTDKLPTKLVEDGIWGPKTTTAFTACGGVISGAQSAPTTGTPQDGTQQGGTQQGGTQQGGTQQDGTQQGGTQQGSAVSFKSDEV